MDTLDEMKNDIDGLKRLEMLMFIDNSTAEKAVHKGTSNSLMLFGLVVRLKRLKIYCEMKINLFMWQELE